MFNVPFTFYVDYFICNCLPLRQYWNKIKMLECLQFLSHVTQIWYIEVTYQIVMSSKNIFCFDTNRKAASKLAWPVHFKFLAKLQ